MPEPATSFESSLSDGLSDAVFSVAEVKGLPAPVRRYLQAAIAPGTPLMTSARLRMRGRIRIGRWLPFTAHQTLNPHRGFVWTARVAGVITGSDRYLDGAGAMSWKLAGLFRVAAAEGPDVSRSAAGRAAAEAVWLPTALLPRFGVTWSAEDAHHITAHYRIGTTAVDLHLTLDRQARIRSLVFERWGDPDRSGTWAPRPFGGEVTGYRTFAGLTIPSAGRFGWDWATERWSAGEFFRYEITGLNGPSE
ncbi:DUF6544 family protein [Streptacidiphilus sp. PAMC 29251]